MNTQLRFETAIKALRKEGVKIRQNVQKCCRHCIGYGDLGMKDEKQPYGYTYGGQGSAIAWRDNQPFLRSELIGHKSYFYRAPKPEESVMFTWGNGSAEKIVEAFRAQGFDVEWDGSDSSCVEVKFN